MLVNTCKLTKVSSFFENDAINVTFVRMKLDNKTLWNEAGRVGFVFGLVPEGFVVQFHPYKGNINCIIFKKTAYLCKFASIN